MLFYSGELFWVPIYFLSLNTIIFNDIASYGTAQRQRDIHTCAAG